MAVDRERIDEMIADLHSVMKLKKRMIERDLRVAWTKCPRCGGRLNASMSGRKNHIHAACETKGCLVMME